MVFGLRHLDRFIKDASGHWQQSNVNQKKKTTARAPRQFHDKILENARDKSKRPVFKTPSVREIARAHEFLHRCDVIVLTRNGPDVVAFGDALVRVAVRERQLFLGRLRWISD